MSQIESCSSHSVEVRASNFMMTGLVSGDENDDRRAGHEEGGYDDGYDAPNVTSDVEVEDETRDGAPTSPLPPMIDKLSLEPPANDDDDDDERPSSSPSRSRSLQQRPSGGVAKEAEGGGSVLSAGSAPFRLQSEDGQTATCSSSSSSSSSSEEDLSSAGGGNEAGDEAGDEGDGSDGSDSGRSSKINGRSEKGGDDDDDNNVGSGVDGNRVDAGSKGQAEEGGGGGGADAGRLSDDAFQKYFDDYLMDSDLDSSCLADADAVADMAEDVTSGGEEVEAFSASTAASATKGGAQDGGGHVVAKAGAGGGGGGGAGKGYLSSGSDHDDEEAYDRDQGLEVVMMSAQGDGRDGTESPLPEFHLPDPENQCAPLRHRPRQGGNKPQAQHSPPTPREYAIESQMSMGGTTQAGFEIRSAASGDAVDAEMKAGMRPDGKAVPIGMEEHGSAKDAPGAANKGKKKSKGRTKTPPRPMVRQSSIRSSHHRHHRRRRKGADAKGAFPTKEDGSSASASASSASAPRKPSYLEMAKMGYKELVHAIIRPPRADYREESLGPPAFVFCGRRFTRTDFGLPTERGLTLRCSHWEPVDRPRGDPRLPVVVYMHGNSSARVEVVPQLSYLLSLGVAVFSFDFAGSGKSDGEYVSLGYYEREDLMAVISHLRSTRVVSTVALWGRSMGAATALMHGDRDPSIACMILDSPFADLTQLAEEMVEKGREQGIAVPGLVVNIAIRMIRGSVKKKADFDIKRISPIRHADKCFIPALFVAGEHDDFIHKRHSEAIHARYAGDKNLIVVEGDHNSPRPRFMFDSASIFLRTCLGIPEARGLNVPPGMNLLAPPWFFPGGTGSGMVPVPVSVSTKRNVTPNVSPSKKPSGVLSPGRPAEEGVEVPAPASTRSASSRTSGTRSSRTAAGPPGAAGSNNGFDSDKMGVTRERQREIQASLFKMLGQADEGAAAGAGGGDGTAMMGSGTGAAATTTRTPSTESDPPPPPPPPPPPGCKYF